MKIDKLELLALAENFEVSKIDTLVYKVELKDCNLCAIIEDEEIEYYITGVYNNGSNMEILDLDSLLELKKFCELMIGE